MSRKEKEIQVLAGAITKSAILLYLNSIGLHYVFLEPDIRLIASYAYTQYFKTKSLPSLEHLTIKYPYIKDYNIEKYINIPDIVDFVIPMIQNLTEQTIKEYDIEPKEIKRILTVLYDISFLVYQNNGIYITDNIQERLDSYKNETETYIRTGISALDTAIKGFTKNTLSVILAKTNIGKSFMLQHFAISIAKQNYNVLLVSTEMDKSKIVKRIDAALLDTPMNKLKRKRPEELKNSLMKLKGKLYISQFPAAHLTVEELESYVEYVNNTLFHVDVLVLDYADELSIKGFTEFEGATHIFSYLRGMASKFNIAIITATQGNRDTFDADTISISKVGRSYRGIAIADLVLGLAQTDKEYLESKLRILVLKNRDNEKGQMVTVKTEFHKGKITE